MTSNAKPTSRSSEPKAGKKKSYKPPAPMNQAKQEARELGEQQFVSPTQLSVPAARIVFDKNQNKFVTKIFADPVNFLWDEDRKHFVYSPRQINMDKQRDQAKVTIIDETKED